MIRPTRMLMLGVKFSNCSNLEVLEEHVLEYQMVQLALASFLNMYDISIPSNAKVDMTKTVGLTKNKPPHLKFSSNLAYTFQALWIKDCLIYNSCAGLRIVN